MGIYGTRHVLKLPRYGDVHTGCDWIDVYVQGVPEHCGPAGPGAPDPYDDFLLEYVASPAGGLHAIAIVREDDVGDGLRYSEPLVLMSAAQYFKTPFEELLDLICDRLRGNRPRWLGEFQLEDGSTRVVFEDNSSILVPPDKARTSK
ncbi:MAG: hypothetical protein HOW73_48270 [Polyangiaceae bacterium]|nr:hypothetical protein [Polyangiaceae bacterium]